MERRLKKILTEARNLGACKKIDKILSWKDLIDAFYTPYGTEFMAKKDFPSIDTFRTYKGILVKRGIYVDAGNLTFFNNANVGLVGKTTATIRYYGTGALNILVVMKGAVANIEASGHAVVKVYNIGGEVNITKDKTAKIL